MYSPTTKLIAKTSTVRLRTCSRVGQLTFFSSDQTSSKYRRSRFTSSFFSHGSLRWCGRGDRTRTYNRWFWRPVLCQLSYTPAARPAVPTSPRGEVYAAGSADSISAVRSGWDRSSCSCASCTSAPCTRCRRAGSWDALRPSPCRPYSWMLTMAPAPTVRPPSRMAKRWPTSRAIGVISSTVISTLSPGMIISAPSGRPMAPVTSVVRR